MKRMKMKIPTTPPTMGEMSEVRLCGAEVVITVGGGVEDVVATIIDISGVLTIVLVSVAGVEGGCVGVVVDWEVVLLGVVTKRLVDEPELEQLVQSVGNLITKVMVLIVAIKAARLRSRPR